MVSATERKVRSKPSELHPKKVAMVTGSFPDDPCGVGDYTARLSQELARQGINVCVLTTDLPEIKPLHPSITVCKVVKSWRLCNTFRFVRFLKAMKPDIIHIQYPTRGYRWFLLPNFLPLICWFIFPKLCRIATIHEFTIAHKFRKIGMIFLLLLSNKIIFPDQHEASAVLKWLPWFKGRYTVIPIGANIEPVSNTVSSRRMAETPYIVYFGFATKSKDVITLFHAFKQLLLHGVQCKLVMITRLSGDDHSVMKKSGIEHAITVTGYCTPEQVSRYFTNATACVLPFKDGVSLRRGTFLTALRHGLPVVTTMGENVPEVLKNWENVILTPIGDYQAMSDAILKLFHDPGLRNKISDNARELGKSFSWDNIGLQHVALYSSMLT
ncbi:MAG TPA: glycosyltransferase family 4 protein [Candidatus Wunengus sp. YC63]|uniref:glycosyltransferase family 4 protein n=1 Tax=unclassified Candidatus Wunengus TaxID=3367695 RepID=UPI002712CBEF|nr:glycosyltransferase family 4 protein [Candidatus Brocadiales bacterium]